MTAPTSYLTVARPASAETEVRRSSDDGEPSGTAGAPMLEVLRGRGVSDVVAVVTRYFGGVLLGAGGLVRAYSDAVRAGLHQAGVRERRLVRLLDAAVPHAQAGKVENDLRSRGVTVLAVDYEDRAVLHLGVAPDEETEVVALLAGLTGGEASVVSVGSEWA